MSHLRGTCGDGENLSRQVSVRDLRDHIGDVVAAVRAGERVSLTVNRMPVADIVPHQPTLSPRVTGQTLRRVLADAPPDRGLLDDLAAVRGDLIDDA